MWGARQRDKKRHRANLQSYTFDNVKERVKRYSTKLKKQKLEQVTDAKRQIAALLLVNPTLVGRENIHRVRDNMHEIQRLQERIAFVEQDKPFEEFVERVAPLLVNDEADTRTKTQQRYNVFTNLFHQDQRIPSFIEHETCTLCNKDYVYIADECLLTCPGCGGTETVLSDFDANTVVVADTKNTPYERGPLYTKYLMQFYEHAPTPPPEVINIVYKHLSRVHVMLSTKVKPTPIAQILRNEKLQKWTSFAVRIAKMINQEPVITLTQSLIDRLVDRFNKVATTFATTKTLNRKKIMNFEFLTKQFLHMEQRPDLADWFACHKTRSVLKQADNRLLHCSKILREKDNLNWHVARSC